MIGNDSLFSIPWPKGRPLRLERVVVRRQQTAILEELDLEFLAGKRYVLIGPSGAGKSTLLRLLNRLEDPSEGRVRIGQDDLRNLPIRHVRSAIGLVFQSPRPLPGTVAENLEYPSVVRGFALPSAEEMAGMLVEVGLPARCLPRDASELSGGERQRLALAVALSSKPEFLALDEPTSALDPNSARLIADLLSEKAESQGLRTIVVTHHRGHASLLGDTAVIMERGKVVEVGPMAEVLARTDATVWQGPLESGGAVA